MLSLLLIWKFTKPKFFVIPVEDLIRINKRVLLWHCVPILRHVLHPLVIKTPRVIFVYLIVVLLLRRQLNFPVRHRPIVHGVVLKRDVQLLLLLSMVESLHSRFSLNCVPIFIKFEIVVVDVAIDVKRRLI